MRFLIIIFSCYILLLPSVPCTDADECKNISQNSVSLSSNHQEPKHNEETCNPFCVCACCGQILVSGHLYNKTIIVKPLVQQKEQLYFNNNLLPSDFFGNIWQPPKLV